MCREVCAVRERPVCIDIHFDSQGCSCLGFIIYIYFERFKNKCIFIFIDVQCVQMSEVQAAVDPKVSMLTSGSQATAAYHMDRKTTFVAEHAAYPH